MKRYTQLFKKRRQKAGIKALVNAKEKQL